MALVSSKRYGYKVQLNKLKSGDVTYYIVYRSGDKIIYQKVGRKSEGLSEKNCIEFRNSILSEQRNGVDLSKKSAKYLTFDELAALYFKSLSLESRKRYQQQYEKHLSAEFGLYYLAQIDDSDLDTLRYLKRKEGYALATVKQFVSLATRIANFGVRRGIISHTPFKDVKPFKIDNTRLRYLQLDEITTLKNSIENNLLLKLFVKIALGTGARAVGILSIQKKDVNIVNRSLTIKDFKRKITYTAYLEEDDFNFIVNHIKDFKPNGYVVSLDGKVTKYQKIYLDLTKHFEAFNKDLKKSDRVNRVVVHTLRHTFASHLSINGTPLQEIQALMNHKDIKQTMKYAKLMPNSGRKYVQDLYKG